MNAIVAAVLTTMMSLLVSTSAMAQTQSASTLDEMKSAAGQQANQEKHAAKNAVRTE